MDKSTDRITDEQIMQVLAEETHWPTNWQSQMEYIAAALGCLVDGCAELPEGRDEHTLLVNGELLPFRAFRQGLTSLRAG